MIGYVYRLVAALLIASVSSYAADDSGWVDDQCKPCFRGEPREKCCSFFLVESGWAFQLDGASGAWEKDDAEALFSLQFGPMWNISEHDALGGTLMIGGTDGGARFALTPRYRRWFSHALSLDLRAGMLSAASSGTDMKFPGFVGGAAISLWDVLSLDLTWELYQTKRKMDFDEQTGNWEPEASTTVSDLYIGLSGRSYAAWVAPVATLVVLLFTGYGGPNY